MPHRSIVAVAGVVSSLATASALAQGHTFTPLPPLESGSACYAQGVSADGRLVIGSCVLSDGQERGVVWVDGIGPTLLPPTGIGEYGMASAVSADGRVIVGQLPSASRMLRWVDGGTPTYIDGLLPSGSGWVRGVSGNGTIAVGQAQTASTSQAFRWDLSVGTYALGVPLGAYETTAVGVCRDGSVVVGRADFVNLGGRAVRWDVSGAPVFLATLPGASESSAESVSPDGSVIVGSCNKSGRPAATAVRWLGESTVDELGSLYPCTYSVGLAASPNGAVILGQCTTPVGESEAWVWSPEGGMVSLASLLGNALPAGWTIHLASGVSDDGRMIVGNGRNPDGVWQGFVVRLSDRSHCRADFNCDGFVNGNDYDSFAALFEVGDGDADLNRDCFVNGNDYDTFAEAFELGC